MRFSPANRIIKYKVADFLMLACTHDVCNTLCVCGFVENLILEQPHWKMFSKITFFNTATFVIYRIVR